ncbi:MAG: TMEM175 family protein [Actinomycetota bacterium]
MVQPERNDDAADDARDAEIASRERSPDRVAAFVDAVFAIVITILVLEIGVPSNLSEQSFREALDEIGPTLIAWVISFFLVGMYWVWHRDLFNRLRAVNRDVVWLNLVFLVPVSLIPFASAVLGDYHDDPIALRLYGLVLIAVSLTKIALYWYIHRRPYLLLTPSSDRTFRIGVGISAAPIALYVLAMALADVAHQLSLIVFLAVPGSYFLLVTLLRERPATAAGADQFS